MGFLCGGCGATWRVFLGGKRVSEGWRPIRVMGRRQKRKYRRMFTDEELEYAARILNFFAPRPRCVCGSRSFKYRIGKNGMLEAFCLECNMRYMFEPKKRMWLHTAVSPLLAAQDEIIIQNDEAWELILREKVKNNLNRKASQNIWGRMEILQEKTGIKFAISPTSIKLKL